MDLKIVVTDEDEQQTGSITIYQDGSDSEGTKQIIDFVKDNFETEEQS
jgi:hypothetical protein